MGSVVNKSAGDAIIEKPREPAHIIVGIARMMLPVHANRSITRAYKTLYPLLRSHPYPLVYPDSYSGLQLGRDPASPPSPSQEHLNIPPGRLLVAPAGIHSPLPHSASHWINSACRIINSVPRIGTSKRQSPRFIRARS